MTIITKEQAKRLRNDFECWQQDYDPKEDKEQYDMFGLGMAAMDMLIAGMYQDPVAWDYEWASCITCEGPQDFRRIIEREAPPEWAIDEGQARNITPLYRHPQPFTDAERAELQQYRKAAANPAPVVPDEFISSMEEVLRISDRDHVTWRKAKEGIAACRAAMLQAEPVSQPCKLPGTIFKPVSDLYGVTSSTGSETSFTFDAVEARDFIAGGWSCQEYVELERFQQAVAGNSPAVPDGWVMVPKEPTAEMQSAAAGAIRFDTTPINKLWTGNAVYRAMLAAAPQQGDE